MENPPLPSQVEAGNYGKYGNYYENKQTDGTPDEEAVGRIAYEALTPGNTVVFF